MEGPDSSIKRKRDISSSSSAGNGETVSGIRSMESKHVPLIVLRCKVLIVGDACVGKTALSQVFHSGGSTFPKNYLMTVGAEFLTKQVPISDTNAVVEMYIFDCAGQSIFNQVEMNSKYVSFTKSFYFYQFYFFLTTISSITV